MPRCLPSSPLQRLLRTGGVSLSMAACLLAGTSLLAQDQKPLKFGASTSLVVQSVIVTDSSGRPIEGPNRFLPGQVLNRETKIPSSEAFSDPFHQTSL